VKYDFKEAWDGANYRKMNSNLARCYIEVVALVTREHRKLGVGKCHCIVCEVFARSQSDAEVKS